MNESFDVGILGSTSKPLIEIVFRLKGSTKLLFGIAGKTCMNTITST